MVTRKTPVKKVATKSATRKKAPARKPENNQSPVKKKSRGGRAYVRKGTGVGGARPGAGRKKGATTKRTREIANKLMESDEISPLEYMLQTLRETPDKLRAEYKKGEIDAAEFAIRLQHLQKRRDDAAKDAAPYIHPRLSSIEAKVEDTGHEKMLALLAEAGL
jgi:hypothetical protein